MNAIATAQEIIIREATPADAPAIAQVHVDGWREAYQGIVAEDYLAALSYAQRTAMWTEILQNQEDEGYTFVAVRPGGAGAIAESDDERADEVIGFISGGSTRGWDLEFQGEVGSLYLCAGWQHHGLGRRLMATAAGWLLAHGYGSLIIWAVAANEGACAFYTNLGGLVARRQSIMIGSDLIDGVAYGWNELRPLARLLTRSGVSAA